MTLTSASALLLAAMDERAKRRKGPEDVEFVRRLMNIGGTSNASLRKILEEVRAHKDDLTCSVRMAVKAGYQEYFNAVCCTIKLPLKIRGEFSWELCEPGLLLSKMVSECPALASIYLTALQQRPSSRERPWHLVVAWDEFAPGDKLHADNRRKSMVLSFSFTELGNAALCRDWTWCTPVVVRSTAIASVKGGWSNMLGRYLRMQLLGAHGLTTAGVPLVIEGQHFLLFAKLSNLLSDGEGFQKAFCWKGAAGLKPCLQHHNIFKLNSDLAHRRPGFVEVDCHDPALFSLRTDADLVTSWDLLGVAHGRVQAGTMTKAAFDRIEKMEGLTYQPDGLLSDVGLREHVRIIGTWTIDWVHTLLQDGVFTTEAWQFIKASGITTEQVCSFLADDAWEFPNAFRTKAKGLYRVFDSFRGNVEHDKLKCSASECLGLYGLLRFFFDIHVPREAATQAKRSSFEAACQILDLILLAKRGVSSVSDSSGALMGACIEHLRLHKAAYGTRHLKPKNHWLLDIPPQMSKNDVVLDAFVIERNHLLVKHVAENIRNTVCFERSVLSGAMNAQFRQASLAMEGSVEQSPLECIYGRLSRVQHLEMAAHMSYLALKVTEGLTYTTLHERLVASSKICVTCVSDSSLTTVERLGKTAV